MRDDGITLVFLSQCRVALIDNVDAPRILRHKWHLGTTGYAVRTVRTVESPRGTTVRMHRVIAGTPKGMDTDHINGRILDNRRCNLRHATHAENTRNSATPSSNRSGYRGVGWHPQRNKWRARIKTGGVERHLGLFDSAKEAAMAYDEAVLELFGEFARTNF